MRQQNFKANVARIKEINSNTVNSFTVAVNKYADFDPQCCTKLKEVIGINKQKSMSIRNLVET